MDTLTGLGNRAMYEQEFETVITAESMGLYYVAYIGADMRRYPGSVDSVQCRTAQILSAETQEYEFISRVGDDSFIFVFQALNSGSAMDRISDLIARLNRESSLPRKMRYRAGVYVITDYKTTPNAALRDARRGWLFAEKKDEDCCLVDRAALEKAEKVERFERTLQKALDHQEFKMYMRFVETAKGGKICGAEARSRWQNPREGTIKRADYINVMIEAHIIDRMDFYLLERVCEQLEEWNGTEYGSLFISCEIREQTILRKDFVKQLLEITSSYHFDHKNLVLELSEAILASEGERLKSNIFACHTAGFRVALGSFGSSQTSLMDFYDYLLDIVKVDAKLTKKVKLSKGEILLRNMIRMAHDLKMEVLCQGLDNTEQLEAVAKLDCDYVQNEVASKELPQDVAMEYLEKRSKEKLLTD